LEVIIQVYVPRKTVEGRRYRVQNNPAGIPFFRLSFYNLLRSIFYSKQSAKVQEKLRIPKCMNKNHDSSALCIQTKLSGSAEHDNKKKKVCLSPE